MKHIAGFSLILVIILGVFASAGFAQESTAEPESTVEPEATEVVTATQAPTDGSTYVVQPGDNLFRIALRYGLTTQQLATANRITNPSLIYVGQVLTIPTAGSTPQPTSTPPPATTSDTYTVQPGDTLSRLAIRFGTTITELLRINNIANPNIIFVGQTINIPTANTPAPEPVVTENAPQPEVTEEAAMPPADTTTMLTDPGFDYGIIAYFNADNITQVTQQINQLGLHWVKVRVDWFAIEPEQDNLDFSELDLIVNTLDSAGLNILFTVTNAPAWSRTSQNEMGPPEDLNLFFEFVQTLATRYSGRVDAYQIWEEPNLRRNWNCDRRMCDTDYLFMLGESYKFIKQIDPNALVISAGLAPTRFNDRFNAIDDRLYLETLYSRGLDTVTDAIAIHPGGEANPPRATCCNPAPGVESHYENDVFYFLENIQAYHEIMEKYGDTNTPLWVTKFGWGTGEDITAPTNANQPHYSINYTSLSEQAVYIPEAFDLGKELGYIGVMFLDNLNGCIEDQGIGLAELCYTSLLAPDGNPRPAFTAVQAIDK